MTALSWDNVETRTYETGIDHGVLYTKGVLPAVAWNGLKAVNETPTGGDPVPQYLDGVKIQNYALLEEFEATLEAYTYPDEFALCDGTANDDGLAYTQQDRLPFDLSYRTLIGNAIDGTDYGYKIHLIYNAMAAPSSAGYQTIGSSTDPISFSWKITTTPVPVDGFKPTAHVILDSTKLQSATLGTIEEYLYGTDLVEARMLYPADLKEILPWLFFEVVPDPVTGIGHLVASDTKRDLRNTFTEGVYMRAPKSRLKESSTAGFYTLDV